MICRWFSIVFFVIFLTSMAYAQQAVLEGRVVDINGHGVPRARVTAPPGQAAETKDNGQFEIVFPTYFKVGHPIQLHVAGWVIFTPTLGKWISPRSSNREKLTITVVPSGSRLALLTPERLGQLAEYSANEATKRRSPMAGLREYTDYYGIPLRVLLDATRQWANSKKSNSKYKQALQQYLLGNYKQAELLMRQFRSTALEAFNKADKEKQETASRLITGLKFRGNVLFIEGKFRESLAGYQEIETLFSAGRIRKEDFRDEWADLKALLGKAKAELGARVSGEERRKLLSESPGEFEEALTVFTRESKPLEWARTQNNMAVAFAQIAKRSSGEEERQFYDKAIDAYGRTLTVYTREAEPVKWALVQNNLGLALGTRGERLGGRQGVQLVERAIRAFELALTILTRQSTAYDWADAQNNLAVTLFARAEEFEGQQKIKLLDRAIRSYELALTVNTRTATPKLWATTHSNIANALVEKGKTLRGQLGKQLLDRATPAYKLAFTVLTRKSHPEEWAANQANQGMLFAALAEQPGQAQSLQLLDKAIEAYGQSLTVFGPETMPDEWATAQNNLGNAFTEKSRRLDDDEQRLQLLEDAVRVYEQLLKVWTRESTPEKWVSTLNVLGATLALQAVNSDAERGLPKVKKAVHAYELALTYRTREESPEEWAETQNNLGLALGLQGQWTDGEKRQQLLDRAIESFKSALTVFTPDQKRIEWANTNHNLGISLSMQGRTVGGEKGSQMFDEAVEAFQSALTVRKRDSDADDWADTHDKLATIFLWREDWPNAAKSLANVLLVRTGDEKRYQAAAFINHEKLFNYAEAFRLNQQWQENNDDPIETQADFAVRHFTTARFVECERLIAKLLSYPSHPIEPDAGISLRVVEIANLLALGKTDLVPTKLRLLISTVGDQPENFRTELPYDGVRHFVDEYASLSPYRGWLTGLFNAIESNDRQAILKGLQELQAKLLK